ncbi:superfamily II DNA or RNA helicase [Nonlabens dokdonensis]|uniref:Type III restriction enzyme protein n=2 Tax=Nonlabens dokdonensis TaxID=328515 RepID=L7WE15_NONDD|nr:DEAD/DEAH box helicase [Nonlabens dokdonensis]AGC78522.1 type III restriction enzyme protein [Nonlabens dokdonensis DSW-6]PZX38266.1 superfamily II DNA or RNA helicase [Nonlabens dokdonensis]
MKNETEIKSLYDYQNRDLEAVFDRINNKPDDYNLLYQLPTGGGKTVIFSEIVRRYIRDKGKKVVILTHRIELCKQTSKMLNGFNVKNKVINSKVKELDDQKDFDCFVAMVETLNNRIQDDKLELDDIGLVIIDEAHYNSFRKLFKYFDHCFMLGVTATPLSSNFKLPMKDNYRELIVGNSITSLVEQGFLAQAVTHTYDVGLSGLTIGMNGDYTVKSSEKLYTAVTMQDKLLQSYNEVAKGKKTLIFNNGIRTSIEVEDTFRRAGIEIRHLDNTNTKEERKEILRWFRNKPDAVLTSVSILTTGFDEPSVECIILNRATKSLTLYYQMIGRGSRILDGKKEFQIIDLGNNVARFGLWNEPVDWQQVFRSPDFYVENIVSDEEIERNFVYQMPEATKAEFPNTKDFTFDIKGAYKRITKEGRKSKDVLDESIAQHVQWCVENSEDVFDARILAKLLKEDIKDRIRRYAYCIINNTNNYKDWLEEDYYRRLRMAIQQEFAGVETD